MIFHGREEQYMVGLKLEELKTLHRALWNDLKRNGTLGVDEEASDLLHDLQTVLQREAQREGVDISIHSEWAAWAGLDSPGCSLRRD